MNNANLIILDWGDTLFPTSWTTKNNFDFANDYNTNDIILTFSQLDTVMSILLLKLTKNNRVIIVTNATKKWVMMSERIIPNSYKFIIGNIPIFSARDLYSSSTNIMPSDWKKCVFVDIMEKSNRSFKNILSVGDAEYEIDALSNLHKKYKIKGKTLRFVKNPNYKQIIEQLEMLTKTIDKIMESKRLVDLSFSTIRRP